jgi:hypothetical protein
MAEPTRLRQGYVGGAGTRTLQGKKRCASSRFLPVVLGAFMPSPLRGSRLRHLLSRDQGHPRVRRFDLRGMH